MSDAKHQIDHFFSLKKPCENCPFRKDGAIELRPERLQGIIDDLLDDDQLAFHCHKTVHHAARGGDWGEDGNYVRSGKEAMCAGAMIYLQKVGRLSVQMRLGVLTGHYDMAAMAAQQDIVIEAPAE